ncbi:MAG: helix-turn-helix transcriptional regulator [Clostridiales bacterium]|nr:helix-turn-helix transcriptional regulator [Clostridiales bacterium]
MTIGEKIKNARLSIPMTQSELAKKLSVTPQNISQYERGIKNPKMETIAKIAMALGCRIEDLLELETFDSGAEFDKRRQEIIDSFKGKDTTEVAVAYKPGGEVSRLEITHTTPPITRINNALDCLNDEGQRAAAERVEELTEIPKYQADKTPPESK